MENIENLAYCKKTSATLWNDSLTPVSAYLQIRRQSSYSFLLESAEQNEFWGRYSFIGVGSLASLIQQDFASDIIVSTSKSDKKYSNKNNPADLLHKFMQQFKSPHSLPPAFGYFGYHTIKHFENIAVSEEGNIGIPDFLFVFPEIIITFDHYKHNLKIDAFSLPANQEDASPSIDKTLKILSSNSNGADFICESKKLDENYSSAFSANIKKAKFIKMVSKAKEYIKEGDIFQVVLSQRWSAPFDGDPFEVYRSLRHINPSPYLFYLNYPDFQVAGSSPEILIKKEGLKLISRPIAGTRKRGKNQYEDKLIEEGLLNDEKELAEHMMLVDLARNDLGRISRFNSIKVTKYLGIENYSHVKHIVSTIESIAESELSLAELLRATFPAGTLSGAPKIRAMEIIDELENFKRCFYGGGVARIDSSGNLDSCIAIRSAVFKDKKAFVQAGAGIVHDSIPEKEYEETFTKASAIFKAINYAKMLKTSSI